jgi:hypothetical protein
VLLRYGGVRSLRFYRGGAGVLWFRLEALNAHSLHLGHPLGEEIALSVVAGLCQLELNFGGSMGSTSRISGINRSLSLAR